MSKLIILAGISGSGKSTMAHNLWLEDQDNVVVVNRDKIRELLFGYAEKNIDSYYSLKGLNKREKEVTKYENLIIQNALNDDKTVIVDATHLKKEYIQRYNYFNVPIKLSILNIDVDIAIQRDNKRTRMVGEDVIRKQYQQYLKLVKDLEDEPLFMLSKIELDKTKPPCIIFDIDGTLAHNVSRSPFDWSKVKEDVVDKAVANVYDLFSLSGFNVIICSGRDEICRQDTLEWLGDEVPPLKLYMRKTNDYRPDWIVKEEMWRDIAQNYNILFLVDDRQQVVDRARSLGLKVFQVEPHNF